MKPTQSVKWGIAKKEMDERFLEAEDVFLSWSMFSTSWTITLACMKAVEDHKREIGDSLNEEHVIFEEEKLGKELGRPLPTKKPMKDPTQACPTFREAMCDAEEEEKRWLPNVRLLIDIDGRQTVFNPLNLG